MPEQARDLMADYDAAQEQHRKANEEYAPLVEDGWVTDIVGGSPLGSVVALCPICFSYVPNTNVAKVMHQRWHEDG